MNFVVFVYTGAVAYGGFWLGAKFGTLKTMKDRFVAWVASLASK